MLSRGEVKRFWEGCQLRIFQRDRRKGWKKGRDAESALLMTILATILVGLIQTSKSEKMADREF